MIWLSVKSWSQRREQISTLVRLAVTCSKELDGILKYWAQLEVMSIRQFTQLSLADVAVLVPQLRDLKLVNLPERITLFDAALLDSIRDHLFDRNPRANISLVKLDSKTRCRIVQSAT